MAMKLAAADDEDQEVSHGRVRDREGRRKVVVSLKFLGRVPKPWSRIYRIEQEMLRRLR
jgi:hypothetical protein